MKHFDELREISAGISKVTSGCEFLLPAPPEMTAETAQVYKMVVYRRTEHHGWALDTPAIADARERAVCRVVSRNINNDYLRHSANCWLLHWGTIKKSP